jgi:predicted secreted hydrolase
MRNKFALFTAAFVLALPGYRYEFPRDHFSHPDYQTEWWYYTGNLRAGDGHRFGFELTFFRQGVSRDEKSDSPWKLDDVYLAHLALTDITGQRFYHTSRLNRAGPGFAGASAEKAQVWNGNWMADWQLPPPKRLATSQELHAITEQFSFDLSITSTKPPVIHGLNGVSQKAEGLGRASHYVSFTRLETSGTLQLNGRRYAVTGSSWMDHEFFTHQLEDSQTGWDWFSLQLANNTELMLFRIRRKDGSADPYSAGTFVDAQGRAHHLTRDQFSLDPIRRWNAYPVDWKIRVPSLDLALDATTPLDSQELKSTNSYGPSYWEGAINLSGTESTKPLQGVGYLEMTGYDGHPKL